MRVCQYNSSCLGRDKSVELIVGRSSSTRQAIPSHEERTSVTVEHDGMDLRYSGSSRSEFRIFMSKLWEHKQFSRADHMLITPL